MTVVKPRNDSKEENIKEKVPTTTLKNWCEHIKSALNRQGSSSKKGEAWASRYVHVFTALLKNTANLDGGYQGNAGTMSY